MPLFEILESDQFLADVEEAAVWIISTNIEQSDSLAESKLDELGEELNSLRERLRRHPESGESDSIDGLRKFPVYGGRYSAKWIVSHSDRRVTLLALSDSKYPRRLRQFFTEE